MRTAFLFGSILSIALCSLEFAHSQDVTFRTVYGEYVAPLYYNHESGDLTIDVTEIPGDVLTGYSVNTNRDSLRLLDRVLDFENHRPFMSSNFITADLDTIGESNFSGVASGVYSLGEVAPVGLSEEEFFRLFADQPGNHSVSNNSIVGSLGGGAFRLEPVYTPSPLPPINIEGMIQHERWASSLTLEYDRFDGSVTLDSSGFEGGAFSAFRLFGDELSSEEFVAIQGGITDADDGRLYQIAFGGFAEGRYDLGNILPSGLAADELSVALSESTFIGHPGHNADFDIATDGSAMRLAIVPEPFGHTTAWMFLVACAYRHSRKKQ